VSCSQTKDKKEDNNFLDMWAVKKQAHYSERQDQPPIIYRRQLDLTTAREWDSRAYVTCK